jgi:hypothetical protein
VLFEIVTGRENSWKKQHSYMLLGFSIFYLLWCIYIIDFRIDHIYFYLLIASFMLLHKVTRKFALGMLFFIIFWIIYDGLRVFPNHRISTVNIIQPYEIEKSIFGLYYEGSRVTLNEYFRFNSHKILDIITALFYITWVPIPLSLAIYFFFKDTRKLLLFTACYLFANLIGFIGYYSYPAAPPWYFDTYGDVFRLDVGPSAAGLLRFDKIIGFPLFEGLYTKNSNVFAAIPSMHSAYPIITWYFARKNAPKWFVTIIFIDIIGIWFSAVYSFHHYFIDVLLGGMVAFISIFIFENFILKSKFSNFIGKFAKFIDA